MMKQDGSKGRAIAICIRREQFVVGHRKAALKIGGTLPLSAAKPRDIKALPAHGR